MTAEERWARLLQILGERARIDVAEAAEALGVSAATVRRDMNELARQRLLTRTRGGAVPTAVAYDLPLRYKTARRADEKRRIAEAAAALVPAGSVVGLNGGTTTSEVARALVTRTDPAHEGHAPALTVVTNAINIAHELAVRPQVKTVVTGGVIRPDSYELTGPLAAPVLDRLALDVAILGVDAVHHHFGAATHDEGEAGANRALAERAARVVLVADSTKLGRRAFAQVCRIGAVSALVTDLDASEEETARLTERGVEVTRV